jgi:hypothetical protein
MADERDEMKASNQSDDEALDASPDTEEEAGMGEQARQAGQAARQQASVAREAARQRMASARSKVRQSAQSLKEQARQRAGQWGEQLKSQSEEYLDRGKSRAAEQVDHLSQAIRGAGEKLREGDQEFIAGYIDAVADQIDRVGGYLRDRDFAGLLGDARDIARRHPVMVTGGMFVAGLALARFLKAGRPHDQGGRGGYDFERDEYGAYGGAGSAGEALYEAQSRYGESNLPVGATQNQPAERYEPFQSRGMAEDQAFPATPAPSTARAPETGPGQSVPSETPESLNP